MSCQTITPGPIQGVALFAVDECYNPIYDDESGYYDNCATVGKVEPKSITTREAFEKFCPNGNIRAYIPERNVTGSSEVQFNFAWLPDEFLAAVGVINPIMVNGEIVGRSSTGDAVKLLALVYQEDAGSDACGGGEVGPQSIVTAYAMRDTTISSDGDFGTSGFNYTVVGNAVNANIGSGPIPLFYDSTAPDEPAWPDACLEARADGSTVFQAFGPPAECGLIDTVEPEDACVPAS